MSGFSHHVPDSIPCPGCGKKVNNQQGVCQKCQERPCRRCGRKYRTRNSQSRLGLCSKCRAKESTRWVGSATTNGEVI